MADLIPHTGGGAQLTMTSREIAELTGKRHDNVRRTIENLADQGVIVRPQIEDEPGRDALGRPRTTQVDVFSDERGKRDSIVVVAQLSPEFTARLVDRWQELEEAAARPRVPQTLPEALRLAADLAERATVLEAENRAQAQQLIAAAPKVALAEAITEANGAQDLAATAQVFRTGRTRLIQLLRDQGVFKRGVALPYQRYVDAQCFRVVEVPWKDRDGQMHLQPKALVTGKGLELIRRCIDNAGGQPPLLS